MQAQSAKPTYFKQIQEAWVLRWNQKIDESLNLLTDVKLLAGWDDISTNHLPKLSDQKSKESYIEALLLKSSLLRAQGERKKSSFLIKKTIDLNDQILLTRGFRILFELGIDHWINEDLAQAMECFLLAEKKARNQIEKIFALSNLLWCLESLDLPRENIEAQLQSSIDNFSDQNDLSHIQQQWSAYQLRKSFYKKITLATTFSNLNLTGQSEFFTNWVESLPYYKKTICLKQESATFLQGPYLWQGAYRQRTLNGIWLPADLDIRRVSDAIDRLYLWVWWWMADHSQINAEKIIWTLESIINNLEIESQSKENLLLLRNALSWIRIIEPGLKTRIEKLYRALSKITSVNYPLLEIEFLLTQLFFITDQDNTTIKHLKLFPIFYEIYNEIINQDRKTILPRLKRRINPNFQINNGKNVKLIVDVAKNEIRTFNSYQVLKSKPLVKLITLIEKFGKVQFDQIDNEQDIDMSKIYNLVVRVRKLTSNPAVKVRNQEVIKGQEWPTVLVINDDSELDKDLEIESFITPNKFSLVGSNSYLQAAKALLSESFTRKELEKNLKISKATACRMIDKWLQENHISSLGQAKATRYIWLKKGII